jgi:two-component system sensor histidine kinase BaeS
VVLEVSDTGQGIPAEALPHVFDRFYRADASRTRPEESGLGLAIARSIVEAHGGTISAKSSVGVGTTMRITLPA